MASQIKIQRGITIFGAAADSATATITAVGGLTKAFARITNIARVAVDPDAGTATDRNDDDIGCTCLLTSTTQITFTRQSTGDNEDVAVWWEVWEYTGTGGGRDEFVVHNHENITIGTGATTGNGTNFSPTTIADAVPILCGVSTTRTTEDWIHCSPRATITGGGPVNIRVVRQGNGGDCVCSVAAVEFTGIDWSVERVAIAMTSAGTDQVFTVTDVVDWNTAMILNLGIANSVDGNDEIGYTVRPGGSTTEIYGRIRSGHSAATTADGEVAIVRNSKLNVQHLDSITSGGSDFTGGGAAPQEVDVAITTVPSLDVVAVEAFADSDSTAKNYPSAMWAYRLKDVSTVQFKRSRTVGGGDWSLQVIDFTSVDGSVTYTKSLSAAATAAPALSGSFASGSVTARVTRTVAEVLMKPGRPRVVPLAVPSVPAPFFAKNWASTCVLASSWLTDVARASSLVEDRRALSDRPRRVMRARLTGMDRAEVLKMFMAMERWLTQRGSVPIYCDHSRVTASSSGTTLFCTTAYRRFYVGGRVIVHEWTAKNRPTNIQYATIAEIRTDRLILSASLTGTIAAGSRVYPAMDAEISLDIRATPVSDRVVDATLSFIEVVGPSTLPASTQGNPPGVQYHSGRPVFDPAPNWGATLELGLSRSGRAYEQGRGRVVAIEGSRPQFQHVLSMTSLSRAAAWKVLQFFDGVKGRARPFWLVAPESMFEPSAITTTYVDVVAAGNFADVNTFLDQVAIVKRDGTIYIRSIQSTTDNGATWRITFDAVIPSLSLTDVRKVTPAFLVRMQADELVQEWITDTVCEARINVVELLSDSTITITGITDTPSTAAPDSIADLTLWLDAGKNCFHDDSWVGSPTDRDRPCELYPDFSSEVNFWDDARLIVPLDRKPHIPANQAYAVPNSSGRHVILFANGDLSNARRVVDHNHTGKNYLEIKRQGRTPWDNTKGFTFFFCVRTPPSVGTTLDYMLVQNATPATMFRWTRTSVEVYINAGVTDTTMHITGLPEFYDGRCRIAMFRWDPGVSSRVYYDGVLQGSAATSPSQMPTDVVNQERMLDLTGQTSQVADAAIGVQDGWFEHAALSFARALTTAELNQVGSYLAAQYGASWTTIT